MKRVLSVFGTRPEAIKMAPVANKLANAANIESIVAVTAQHRQMLDQVLTLFDITPDYDLDIMQANQDLFDVTSRVLLGLRDTIAKCQPDIVLVHGDTTTCFAASLAAYYHKVPVGHVEAGLRTGDKYSPFPEEANRSLVGRLAHYHFAPTETARQNLLRENIPDEQIWVTGNTVIDALLETRQKVQSYDLINTCDLKNTDPNDLRAAIPTSLVKHVQSRPEKLILVTGHRRENFGQGFIDLCTALRDIAKANPSWMLIYPVHLNPNVQKPVYQLLGDLDNIFLIDPLDYLPFVWLLDKCDLVITDSGGIQEEAPSLGKPVLVTREVTERPEAVDAGTVKLVGTNRDNIVNQVQAILTDDALYAEMSGAHNPYGDGLAAQRILDILSQS